MIELVRTGKLLVKRANEECRLMNAVKLCGTGLVFGALGIAAGISTEARAATVGCDAACNGEYRVVADDPVLAATFRINGVLILDWAWDDGSAVSNNFLSVFRDDVSNDLFFSATISKGAGQLNFLNPIENQLYACFGITGCNRSFVDPPPGSYTIEAIGSVPLPASLPLLLAAAAGLASAGLAGRRS